jgi:glycosyltransferase involved in cell wall biosynthesis
VPDGRPIGVRARAVEPPHAVVCLPFTPEVAPLYRLLEVVLLPSRIEGISQSLLEAMALAKPVVARLDRAALARVPGRMREELPVVDADATSLTDTLRLLATERRAALGELGRRGRAFVERWHDPITIAERVVGDYERALARRRTGGAD